jgi:uncharacterized protein GlcG (DUF336 family)
MAEATLTVKRLSAEGARVLIEGAELKARDIGVPMCIAVADESGNLLAFSRMDGSKVVSIQLAQDKAFTAAVARRPTHVYNEMCVPGNLLNGIQTSHGGRFSTVGGGYPVVIDDAIVGGIGASSGTADEDMACARAGIDHLLAE